MQLHRVQRSAGGVTYSKKGYEESRENQRLGTRGILLQNMYKRPSFANCSKEVFFLQIE